MSLPITVLEVRLLHDREPLKTYAKAQVGPFVIPGFRVSQIPGQPPRATFPRSWHAAAGKYMPAVSCIDRWLSDAIKSTILDAYECRIAALQLNQRR